MAYREHFQKVIHYLFQPTEGQDPPGVYAILDSARDDAVYRKLVDSAVETLCLYRGEQAIELATVAPYLVNLKREDSFTQWLLSNGWGKMWGIFLRSSASLKELRRHFQQFLIVYDEEGTPLYFRFYDPRVLRVYLPTCNESELQTVFGPVDHFYVEGKEEKLLIEFSCTEEFELIQNVINLEN
jgi:hypothetical protein